MALVDRYTLLRQLGYYGDLATMEAKYAKDTSGLDTVGEQLDKALDVQMARNILGVVAGFDVKAYGAVGDGITDDRVALNAALTAAGANPGGGIVTLNGQHLVTGSINVPANVTLDGSCGSITMTASLQIMISVAASNVVIRNVTATGKGSDWVNTASVYDACAVRISGAAVNVTVEGCNFTNFAGAGVRIETTPRKVYVTHNVIIGPGASVITGGSSANFSGGVAFPQDGAEVEISHNEISQYAQGVVGGDLVNARIADNWIHDIVGQHGIYIATCSSLVISNNLITNVVLQGIKLQVHVGSVADGDGIVVTGNTVISSGSHGILLDNLGQSQYFRNVTITGNTVRPGNALSGAGVALLGVKDFLASGNMVQGSVVGIRLDSCTTGIVSSSVIVSTTQQGLAITDSIDIQFVDIRIKNPASANGASTEWGIGIVGTCTDLTFDSVVVTDTLGNMRYGFYNTATTGQATFTVRNCSFSGATDYGARVNSAEGLKEWRNNLCAGNTLGQTLNFPTTFVINGTNASDEWATAAPTTGAHLRGSRCWNSTPSVGATTGWVCTVAGTPGTWVALANL